MFKSRSGDESYKRHRLGECILSACDMQASASRSRFLQADDMPDSHLVRARSAGLVQLSTSRGQS